MAGWRLAPIAARARRSPPLRRVRPLIRTVAALPSVTGEGDTLSEGVGVISDVEPAVGAGNTDSTGVGAVTTPAVWDFDYVMLVVPVTGVGNTESTGIGNVGHPQTWDFTYWDGVNNVTGSGDNLSSGVGAAAAANATWYTITGSAIPAPAATGAGDTLSAGVGAVGTFEPLSSAAGAGDTLSSGGAEPLSTVVPAGGIRLSPYWEPGTLVYVYRLHEWLGSYEARLGAGAGPLVQIAYGDVDTTVAFYGLAPDQYVAVSGSKRVHFMVTP